MPSKQSDAFDFDAWYAQSVEATIPFKILGETWDLPGDVDAAVLLKLQRLEQYTAELVAAKAAGEPFPDIPDGITVEDMEGFSFERICRDLAGDDIVDQWLAKGIPSQMLRAASKRLYAIHSGRDADEAIGLGKPQAAKKPQDRKPKAKKAATVGPLAG